MTVAGEKPPRFVVTMCSFLWDKKMLTKANHVILCHLHSFPVFVSSYMNTLMEILPFLYLIFDYLITRCDW